RAARGGMAADACSAGDARLRVPGRRPRRGEPRGVRDVIAELERIRGPHVRVALAERAAVDQDEEPSLDGQAEVMATARTDVETALEMRAVVGLAARPALLPDAP